MPIVAHGMFDINVSPPTLKLIDVVRAIAKNAFKTSPYPVILNLDTRNTVSEESQEVR